MDILLTPEELAERWKIKTQTLKLWRTSNKGPKFIRFSHKKVLYRLKDIRDFEEENLVVMGA